MCVKYFIFSLIASILITNFAETQSLRGPREYGEVLPTTRTTVNLREIKVNRTSEAINTLQVSPDRIQGSEDDTAQTWEPLACSQCLNDRYLVHYLEKGCKPVDNGLFCKKACPKYFECPKKPMDIVVEGCEYKGKVYKFRERVENDNPCKQSCFCDQKLDEKNVSHPQLTCAHVDCFNNFRAPTPNCFVVWNDGECCPKEKCLTDEQMATERKCLYKGKQYYSNQRIYPDEDPCLECVCNENWNQTNPLKSKSCKTHKCETQYNSNYEKGCIPIYHEKSCCPIEYFCPPPEVEQCQFNGKKYLIGERLEINQKNVECICRMPPDFTCIKKAREESRAVKDDKQKTNHLKDSQTPKEDVAGYVKQFQTLPKIVITNSSDVPFANIPSLNQESKCPPFIAGGLTCAGVNCMTIIDANGCQACKCEQPCPTLKCRKGCNVFATAPGVCPQCQCN